MKENASHGLAEVIKLTSPEALKPSVVHITGPLIRILGDRFGANVKTGTLFLRLFLVRPTHYLLPLNQNDTTDYHWIYVFCVSNYDRVNFRNKMRKSNDNLLFNFGLIEETVSQYE